MHSNAQIDLVQLGVRIRQRRTALGLTQTELAGTTMTKSFVSQIERGRASPSLMTLATIAERLGVPISELLIDQSQRDQGTKAFRDLLVAITSDKIPPVQRCDCLLAMARVLCLAGQEQADHDTWMSLYSELMDIQEFEAAGRLLASYAQYVLSSDDPLATRILVMATKAFLRSRESSTP